MLTYVQKNAPLLTGLNNALDCFSLCMVIAFPFGAKNGRQILSNVSFRIFVLQDLTK